MRDGTGGKDLVGIMVIVQRHSLLFEIVAALRAPGGLAGRLDRRKQQGNQNANDGDDYQQLDQGES